jgi:excisionase family DNA binding protein
MCKLLRIEQTADLLGVSPWTIRAWVAQGKLKSVKLGSRRLVPESEVVRLISEAESKTLRFSVS